MPDNRAPAAVAGTAPAPKIDYSLRPAGPADAAFLRALFTEARADLFTALPLQGPAGELLVDLQFQAQERAYRAAGGEVHFLVVCMEGVLVGRLTLGYLTTGWVQLMDLALLAAWQGGGLGTQVVAGVLKQAAGRNQGVRLSVARGNPAERLYRRLGFVETGADAVYRHMEWRDGARPGSTPDAAAGAALMGIA